MSGHSNTGSTPPHRAWRVAGWALLAAVVILSLVSVPQPVALHGADKFEHVLAYAVLMFWWGMLEPSRRARWALFLPLLGLGLEFAQQFNPDRFMEWRDALANTLGVALGYALAASPAGHLLGWLDRKIGNRSDPRLP